MNHNQDIPVIPVEDFLRRPSHDAYALSPDGNWLAYMAPWQNRQNIYVQHIEENETPVRITSSEDRDVRGFIWKDDTILYFKDDGGNENIHIYSANFQGVKEKDLTPYPNVQAQYIHPLPHDKHHILLQINKENPAQFDVYQLHVKSGRMKRIVKNSGNIKRYIPDQQGKILLAVTMDDEVLFRTTEDQPFQPFLTVSDGEVVIPFRISGDEKKIYAISNQGRDKAALITLDYTGKETLLYAHPDVDVDMFMRMGMSGKDVLFSRRDHRLLSLAYVTDKKHYKFFDPSFQALFQKLQHQLNVSESELSVENFNQDDTKWIIRISNDKMRGNYYYYDVKADKLTFLSNTSAWLNPEHLADMQPISYKSRDGLTIHGYVTLPRNKTPKKLPLIVFPHGGPWYRDCWMFDRDAQLLANRGYAILQPNFRASTGYGKTFLEAGNKEWGGKIQDDITDGVQWVIQQGIVDPKRIGIYGISFGGYSALMGITFHPELYAAAVDYVGVSNVVTLLESFPPYFKGMLNMFYQRVGHPVKDKELLTICSPIFHVDKMKTPLFIAQGANDPRVKKEQSEQIVQALRKRGVEVQYMLKDNEGHGFRNVENQIAFFDKHLNVAKSVDVANGAT